MVLGSEPPSLRAFPDEGGDLAGVPPLGMVAEVAVVDRVHPRPAGSAYDDAAHDSMINPYLTRKVMRRFLAGLLAD